MIDLSFGGDTSLGDAHINARRPALIDKLRKSPESFFSGVAPLMAGSDYVVVNLETVLSVAPESPWKGEKLYLGWDTPEQTIRALNSIGTTTALLANNHTMDFGGEVLLETISQLRAADIQPLGAGQGLGDACTPQVISIPHGDVERRIYIFSLMQEQKSLRDQFKFYATPELPGVNMASTETIESTIRLVRNIDPGALIIASPHWGANYKWVSKRMLEIERVLYGAGADLIIGHGAHMLQQVRMGGGRATVFSLGNFVFNWAGRFSKFDALPFGLVARVSVEPVQGGWVGEVRLYPIRSDNMSTGYTPSPVGEDEFQLIVDVMGKKALDDSWGQIGRGEDDRGLFFSLPVDTCISYAF